VKFIVPSWQRIYDLSVELAEKIRASGARFDLVLSPARGGLVLGRIFSDLLDIEDILVVDVKYYTGVEKREKAPRVGEILGRDVEGKSILIVDDVVDTGGSLLALVEKLKKLNPMDIKVAAIYVKPWKVAPIDFYMEETDAWIIFPWEAKETLRELLSRGLDVKALGLGELVEKLSGLL